MSFCSSLSAILPMSIVLLTSSELLAEDFNFKVGRSPGSAFSDTAADKITQMINAIVDGDTHTGTDCDLAYSLGDIKTIQVPDSVDNQQQLLQLLARNDANVIVVRFLNYCGRYNPAYSGCSDDGLPIVVDSETSTATPLGVQTNAVLWLHEFGHSQKLGHNPAPRNLMNETVTAGNLLVSSPQCSSMIKSNSKFSAPAGAVIGEPLLAQLSEFSQISDLERLLLGPWTHGIPAQDLERHSGDVAEIRKILLNEEFTIAWPNAVLALGMIGAEDDIDFLSWYYEFLSNFVDDVSVETARTNVPLAVGILSGRFNSQRGLTFLASLTNGTNAQLGEGAFKGLSEAGVTQVTKNALVGLAVSPAYEEETSESPGQGTPLAARVDDLGLSPEFADELQNIARESRMQGIESYFGAQSQGLE